MFRHVHDIQYSFLYNVAFDMPISNHENVKWDEMEKYECFVLLPSVRSVFRSLSERKENTCKILME